MEDLRKNYRIQITDELSVSAVDTVGTAVIALMISKYYKVNYFKVLGLLLITGEAAHVVFKQQTPITRKIF